MRIGFIGTGAMGGAMLKGIHEKNPSFQFHIYDKDLARMDETAKKYGATAHPGEASVVSASDIVFLAVKPNHMESVLKACTTASADGKVFITLAVGLPLALYVRFFGEQAKVVRTMPNTPALIGEGITLYCCTPGVLPDERRTVVSLLETAGMVEELEERLMSEVTAVTSSSPAFFFMMIEAMGDAAVLSGIPRAAAYRWAAAAMAGSARLFLQSGKHPGELKDMVTSPGGTTIEGLAVLERNGFRSAVIEAMGAVTRKARAIGESR